MGVCRVIKKRISNLYLDFDVDEDEVRTTCCLQY